MVLPYARGSWRLDAQALHDVALSFSHILVVHRGSVSGEGSNLRGPGWNAERGSDRTREAALERAAAIALEARVAASFEQLAQRYSDDLVTAESGGSLGTWTADVVPAEFLDALAALRPGETSRVVETALGFHVLKRRALLPETQVSARRILISYQPTAPFLRRAGHDTSRTRDEALALARHIALEARRDPKRFLQLVREYSDHADASRDGDIGVWSTARAFPFNRETELIASMPNGEISDPVDSMEGFNVFQRAEVSARQTLALEEIVLSPTLADDGRPDAADLGRLQRLQRRIYKEVRARPERFATYQHSYCCGERRQWSTGRGIPALERAVLPLPLGRVAVLPLDPETGVLRVVRRVPPMSEPASAPLLADLPAPQRPNVDALVGRIGDAEALAAYVLQLAQRTAAELALDPATQRQLDAVVAQLVLDLRTAPPERRVGALREARAQLAALLGDELYAQLRASVDSQLSGEMMGQ
ncbi:MAG TPA: peptidylprolyl isomerase [Polyangiales bacterium]